MLKAVWFIFKMELLLLLRRSQDWLHPLLFFVIIISLFPLAFTPDPVFLQKYLPGFFWIAALLASLLSIQTIFVSDLEENYLEQSFISALPLTLFIFAKLIAQWLITALPLILLIPALSCLFNVEWQTILILMLTLLLGTPILTFVGAFCVALTIGLRQQGVLIGLLLLPLVTPVLIFGVTIVQQFQHDLSVASPLAFLASLTILTATFLPWTIASTLRVSLDD